MSVGGTIIDLVEVSPEKWWANTWDGHTQCAIYFDPRPERPEVGDGLWWQGGHAMWTPRVHPDGRSDVRLKRRGYSGVTHPDLVRAESAASERQP